MSANAMWERALRERKDPSFEDLKDFLKIPSISALPEHAADVKRAAEWCAARLTKAGLDHAAVMPTAGHPAVYADWLHARGKPTVLIYGHFDVQPVDPVEEWTTPPFEPTLRDGRLYARGASDDKGNMLAPIVAVEALLAASGSLPVNVKFFLEGQEEIGSPQMPVFVARNKALLACDHALSADAGQWSETEPEVLMGLRGLCCMEIHIQGPAHDVHSGLYGGAIWNPLHALAEIVASFHTPDGRVAVAGFYDRVVEPSPAERAAIARVPFDEAAWKAEVGASHLYGESGYSTYERVWIRPTLELNGMWGGFQGEGTKTVLPSRAHAKITCRLVPDQEPEQVLDCVEAHVKAHAPKGTRVEFVRERSRSLPFVIRPDHPGNQVAARVLREMYGKEPYQVRSGGSVAICDLLQREIGVRIVGFGFGLKDERYHAPDEFLRVPSFYRAQEGYCRILTELGR